jgi:hypothetical protein
MFIQELSWDLAQVAEYAVQQVPHIKAFCMYYKGESHSMRLHSQEKLLLKKPFGGHRRLNRSQRAKVFGAGRREVHPSHVAELIFIRQ